MTAVVERNRYRMRFTLEGRHLHVRVVGHKDDLDTTVACWMEIAAEVSRTGAATLLVEDDMDGPPLDPAVLPDFLHALRGKGLEGVRIAYVEALPERLPKVELAEILAREQGYVVRVFVNRMDAAVWLRHGER